ncbi:hypothetical protein PL11_001825 [Lentilactobacillus curieae]|uniref:Uncharacterized protein n=1 Tax=Lentilactobacillus curieae TaxID=1138822 RepID=A0A1S6QGL1_9LACO|nr:hypothetical protein [Lentilactobacillus curieae]AQW20742.1 hypothetical protein PL11_001825 [Lentilactobacillus curieae]
MTNVDQDTIENVKGDFTVANGTIGKITFDAKKDGTVYLDAIATNPTIDYVDGSNELGANLNIWRVNVFQHYAPTQTSSSNKDTHSSTSTPTNSVDKKLVAGLDAQ